MMRQHKVIGEHFQSNESCPPGWVQHPTCNSNIPFFSEAFETDISEHLPSLLCCFPGIKTCTDFALSQEVTKMTSNKYFLTSLLLKIFIASKMPGAMALIQEHENTLNRGTDAAHTFLSFRSLHCGRTWFPVFQSGFEI